MESRKIKAVTKLPRPSPYSIDKRKPAGARRFAGLHENWVPSSKQPTFDGTGSWSDFIQRFEEQEIFFCQNPTSQLLASSLRGEAVDAFLRLPKGKRIFCYECVKNHLQSIFEYRAFSVKMDIDIQWPPQPSPNSTGRRIPACARRLDTLFDQCVPIVEKPTFDGTGSWSDFINRFEEQPIFLCHDPTSWLLACSLRGEAVETFLSFPIGENILSYQWVKRQLQIIYEDRDPSEILYTYLTKRKWNPRFESLFTYGNDVMALSEKVFGSYPAAEKQVMTAHFFVAGIEVPEIKTALIERRLFTNIYLAFEFAKQALAELESVQRV